LAISVVAEYSGNHSEFFSKFAHLLGFTIVVFHRPAPSTLHPFAILGTAAKDALLKLEQFPVNTCRKVSQLKELVLEQIRISGNVIPSGG
jgi:hypothetical protein